MKVLGFSLKPSRGKLARVKKLSYSIQPLAIRKFLQYCIMEEYYKFYYYSSMLIPLLLLNQLLYRILAILLLLWQNTLVSFIMEI